MPDNVFLRFNSAPDKNVDGSESVSCPPLEDRSIYGEILRVGFNGGLLELLLESPREMWEVEKEMLKGDHRELLFSVVPHDEYEKFRAFLISWHKALANSGIAIDFADSTTFLEENVVINQEPYRFISLDPSSLEEREKKMAGVKRYSPRKDIEYYRQSGLQVESCALCNDLAQVLDTKDIKEEGIDRLNFLAIFHTAEGDIVWLINKFPYFIGDTLILPFAHLKGSSEQEKERPLRRTSGFEMADVVPSRSLLEVVFAVCDRGNFVGYRNHAMAGKTIRGHDHFKVTPPFYPYFQRALDMIKEIKPGSSNSLYVQRAPLSPFDMMVFFSRDRSLLAKAVSLVLEKMESRGEVYTLSYIGGYLFILPRKVSEHRHNHKLTSSGLNFLAKEPFIPLAESLKAIPLAGEFNWEPYFDLLPA
ncbi:MAG: hypothetical protein D6780_03130, partial [Candidatus Dadabacteria bacterium]